MVQLAELVRELGDPPPVSASPALVLPKVRRWQSGLKPWVLGVSLGPLACKADGIISEEH